MQISTPVTNKITGHSDKPNLWFINMYIYFQAFPCMDIFGFSISLFFVLFLLFYKGSQIIASFTGPFTLRWFFYAFLVMGFLSTFVTVQVDRPPPFSQDFRLYIQYIYWIIMTSFFIVYGKYLNLLELSKWAFLGLTSSLMFFYFLPDIEFKSFIFGINTKPNRNGLLYSCLALIPFSFYYISQRFGKQGTIIALILFNLAIIYTNGRSGTIIFFLETIFIIQVLFPMAKFGFKILIVILGTLSMLSETPMVQPFLMNFANIIEPANPRLANLIRGEDDGNLEENRSWLFRLIMVEKAKELNKRYPALGVGLGHFKHMDGSLRLSYTLRRMAHLPKEEVNRGSPHNSYYMILAECGFLGLFCILVIAFTPIFTLIYKILLDKDLHNSDLIMVGLLGISIHWYSIASFVGGVTWIAIGLSIFSLKNKY